MKRHPTKVNIIHNSKYDELKNIYLFKVFIYLFWERERAWTREKQREKERDSEAGSVLPAQTQHGAQTHEL